tara:strand:- start:6367 stop:6786 length:420 start_codon:yes stop_codon:yes gene_type:complete
MTKLYVKETSNLEEVKKVIFDPEIYERIRVEGVEVKELPVDNTTYIAGYVDGEIIAVMVYYRRKNYTTCHPHVLANCRGKYGVKFVRESFKLRPRDILYTNISPRFPEVIKFAEYFGFKYIGQLSNKDKLYGVNYGFCS